MELKEAGKYVKISGIQSRTLQHDLRKRYGSQRLLNIFERGWTFFGVGSITIHRFFLPELVYLLTVLPPRRDYPKIIELILTQSWLSSTRKSFSSRVNTSLINRDILLGLKPYQKQFIDLYDDQKQKHRLNGYILAFEQGLGKTLTSLALMHGLRKDAVIIVAPKSTIRTVWQNEINKVFKDKQDIWVVGEEPRKARFYIVNYESMEKISSCLLYLTSAKNVGIIVDESHNFRNVKAQRVIRLQSISKILRCEDVLLMSGTPVKAMGIEIIPTLDLIDPYFDSEARKIFVMTFGMSRDTALDIMKNRLGFMMHRKTKEEVLNLPTKTHKEINIRIPDGSKYELENVKITVLDFIRERNEYYKKSKEEYIRQYDECIEYLSFRPEKEMDIMYHMDLQRYKEVIGRLRKRGYNRYDSYQVAEVSWANEFEKTVLRPALPPDLRRQFDRSRSVVKYVDMKVMGEVIGGLLNRLRSEMFSKMLQNSPICDIIRESEKKTICFTTYTDVVRATEEYVKRKCGLNPLLVFGETTGNIKQILNNFKLDPRANPLIATIQTLSTGVTLTEANTIIFLNKPWRFTDISQAEDRVHRIGQDTNVFVFTFTLDTGQNPNLSTRMDDIVKWSKDMFEGMVGK